MKKCISIICALALMVSMAACSHSSGTDEIIAVTRAASLAAADETNASPSEGTGANETTIIYGRVTEANGANITLQLGDMVEGGTPQGSPNDGNGHPQRTDGGNHPARDGQTRPADFGNEDSEAIKNRQNNGEKPEGRGREVFVAGDESAVYDLSAARIIVETMQESNTGSLEDIEVDAILELELDTSGTVVSVNVKPLQGREGPRVTVATVEEEP